MKLDANNLGIAGGILWGSSMLILTIISMYTGYASEFLHSIINIYPGYTITLTGSLFGFIWGFVDAFIGLYLLAWLYNKLNTKKSLHKI